MGPDFLDFLVHGKYGTLAIDIWQTICCYWTFVKIFKFDKHYSMAEHFWFSLCLQQKHSQETTTGALIFQEHDVQSSLPGFLR